MYTNKSYLSTCYVTLPQTQRYDWSFISRPCNCYLYLEWQKVNQSCQVSSLCWIFFFFSEYVISRFVCNPRDKGATCNDMKRQCLDQLCQSKWLIKFLGQNCNIIKATRTTALSASKHLVGIIKKQSFINVAIFRKQEYYNNQSIKYSRWNRFNVHIVSWTNQLNVMKLKTSSNRY